MNEIETAKFIERHWKDGGNIIVTSDIHGFHKNLAKGSSSWGSDAKTEAERQKALEGCRDFSNEVVMTEAVTSNINAMCGEDDILLHNGDWAFGGKQNIRRVRDMIKCKNIITLFGNHDHALREETGYQRMFISCLDYLSFRVNGHLICNFHYPIDEWDEINRGSMHFFGHRHTRGQIFQNGRSMDVGLDGNHYHPYKLEKLIEMFETQPFVRKHH